MRTSRPGITSFLSWVWVAVLTECAYAQPRVEWQQCYGGRFYDAIESMAQTRDGGYVFAAVSYSSDVDVPKNQGSGDYWIVKLDSLFRIQWSRTYGGSGLDDPASIIQTLDGGYAIAGTTESVDGDVVGNHGGDDWWVIKLDGSGNLEWQRCLGLSLSDAIFGGDKAHRIAQTPDSGYVICGSTIWPDTAEHVNGFNLDGWVVRLSKSGAIVWSTKA